MVPGTFFIFLRGADIVNCGAGRTQTHAKQTLRFLEGMRSANSVTSLTDQWRVKTVEVLLLILFPCWQRGNSQAISVSAKPLHVPCKFLESPSPSPTGHSGNPLAINPLTPASLSSTILKVSGAALPLPIPHSAHIHRSRARSISCSLPTPYKYARLDAGCTCWRPCRSSPSSTLAAFGPRPWLAWTYVFSLLDPIALHYS